MVVAMKITKIGHCCLVVEVDGKKILTDPGTYSTGQNELKGIDVVLITHEHADHVHAESLKEVLKNNPEATIITNSAVATLLSDSNIVVTICEGREVYSENGLKLEAFDGKHEEIYGDFGQVQNTGYLIQERLFYPGDSFHDPKIPVDILALPVGGPWCKIGDAIRYALSVKPKFAFPVHDATQKETALGLLQRLPSQILSENGIEFVVMNAGDTKDF